MPILPLDYGQMRISDGQQALPMARLQQRPRVARKLRA